MALNSVKFRIEGDGTSALKALGDVKKGMGDVKNVMAQEITQKIKQAFSVAAIEEMTRRTAEWATQLTNTAKHLQITTQELQGFNIAGGRIGMDSGKIEGFFGTLEDSAYDALKGNTALLISFQKLGIGMDDLRKKAPAQLFEKVLGGLGNATGIQGAQEIFGRGDTVDLQRLSATMGGQGGAAYAQKSGLSVGDNDLQEITVAWRGVLEGIKGIGVQLLPLVKTILAIVDGLIKMIGGVIGTITGVIGDIGTMAGQLSAHDWKGAFKTAGKMTVGRLSNMGAGIGKAVTFGFANKQIDERMKPGNDLMGLSEDEVAKLQGAGEGLATILSFGTGGVGKNVFGASLKSALGLGKTGRIAGMEFGGVSTTIGKGIVPTMVEKLLNKIAPKAWANLSEEKLIKFVQEAVEGGTSLEDLQPYIAKHVGNMRTMKLFGRLGVDAGLGGMAGAAGAVGNADINARLAAAGQGGTPFAGRYPMMNFANGFGGGGGGNANLRIGGVFGADVSFKIIQLNQEMVTIMTRMLAIMEGNRNPTQYTVPAGLH